MDDLVELWRREDDSDSDSSGTSSGDSSRSNSAERHKSASKTIPRPSTSKQVKDSPRSGRNSSDRKERRSPPPKMSSSGDRRSSRRDDRERDNRHAGRQQERDKDQSRSRRDDRSKDEKKSSRDRSKDEKKISRDRSKGRDSRDEEVRDKISSDFMSRKGESKDVKTKPSSSDQIESSGKHRKSGQEKGLKESRKSADHRKRSPADSASDDRKRSPANSAKSKSPSSGVSKKAEKRPSSSDESSGTETSGNEDESPAKKERRKVTAKGKKLSKPSKENPKPDATDTSSDSSSDESDIDRDNRDTKVQKKSPAVPEKQKLIGSEEKYRGDEKRGDTPEKAETEKIVEEGEVEDDEEEKEEGEISEDEDEAPAKPLIAMSEDMSDISSEDEGRPPLKGGKQDMAEPPKSPRKLNSSDSENEAPDGKKLQAEKGESSPPRKVERSNRTVGRSSPGKKEEAPSPSSSRKVLLSQKGRGDRGDGSDHNSSQGEAEDNSQRERPVLESESEEEEGRGSHDGVRSQVESKGRMGSSVSVVKPRDRITEQDGSRDRRRRVDEDSRGDRSSRRDRDRISDRKRAEEDERDSRRRGRNDGGYGRGDRNYARDSEARRKRDDSSERKPTSPGKEKAPAPDKPAPPKKATGDITTRTGGAYIPPAKLRMMQEQITDKTSVAYQRMSWEALKKSINGLINKVNVSNIINIIKELFQENIVRGRGLLARSVIQAQAASPTFTHVYAALVAIINTKFPQNGELILRRLILMFRRGYRRNDKALCLSSTRFIAHLVNQQVAHEVLALEILTLLLETPTDDSVEIAIGFLKECGQKLTEVSPRGINSIFERLRMVLHEGMLDKRVEYMVETMFAIRKDGFQDHQAVLTDLDLVEEEEQFTHLLQVEDAVNGEEILNVFKEDKSFAESEEKYKALKKEILEEGSSDEESEEGSSGSESSESDEEAEEKENAEKQKIIDQTETNLVALRRTIYLTIQSSLDHNECAHKMLKMELKPGQEVELCNMILDCCAQLRTYEKFFGLLAQRFCQIDKKYIEPFQQIFVEQYETIHRLETNKLRNVAKFFAHMLHTDAISWGVLSVVKLTEDDTTSASRIFLKILFQELSEYLGLLKLNQRLKDPTLSPFFEGIMPRDNPKNTRFSINFFTTIGLGGLTDDLREHLKNVTKKIVQEKQDQAQAELAQKKAATPSSSSSSDNSDSSSDSEDDSDSSDSSASESDTGAKSKKKTSLYRKKEPIEKSPVKSKGKKDEKHRKTSKEKSRHGDAERKSGRDKAQLSRDRSDKERQGKDGKRSRSKGKERHSMNGRHTLSPEKGISIAARLLSMAQYGDIAHAAEEAGPDMRKDDKKEGRRGGERDKDRSADGKSRRRKDRSPQEELERRERPRKEEVRQRRDESEDRSGKKREDQWRNGRGRNEEEMDRRKRFSDRDFHDNNSSRERSDFRNGRDMANRDRQNGSGGVARREERDFRDRENNLRADEGRRGRERRDDSKRIDSLERDRQRDKDGKGGKSKAPGSQGSEKRKLRRHDSSSGSSEEDSSASEDSDSSDVSRQRKPTNAKAKQGKPADTRKATNFDRKRKVSSSSPSKRKRPRKDDSSASASSSGSSSEEDEMNDRKIPVNRKGSPPPKDRRVDRSLGSEPKKVTQPSKQANMKLARDRQSSRKRQHSEGSSESGSESESSGSGSSDSSSDNEAGKRPSHEARPQSKQMRREDEERYNDRRHERKEVRGGVDRSNRRGREERVRGGEMEPRQSRERRGRR
ncbi:pre-mRNA-splicing factor CWC22-like protein [Elysia marginata]|uniref:Pre-mRNA-splicing factor CWC22-like protein n=1 Tax=Elysia marginata TaxID=1093978 RepID=A0AAV4JEY6_9GAST|nr:pre-mRNA-splicing factor CWC22-like protein [Elysia marginata]